MFNLSYAKKKYIFKFNNIEYDILKLTGSCFQKVGLLNHLSLSKYNGVMYVNRKLFHTIGMHFPIGVICFDKNFKITALCHRVPQGHVFIVPIHTKFVLEINSFKNIMNDNLFILDNKKSLMFYHLIKKFWIFIFLLILFFSYSSFALERLNINLGKTKILHLSEAPQSIQISNPDILDINRVGLSNSIKIIPKQNGSTLVTVTYLNGNEALWTIDVGQNQYSNHLDQFEDPSGSEQLPLSTLVAPIKKVSGINPIVKNGKIILFGKISTLEDFRRLIKAVAPRPQYFFPAYIFSESIEDAAVNTLQNDLKTMGENNLKIIQKAHLNYLVGVPSTQVGKNRAWKYLNALLPSLVDAASTHVGDSQVLQVNLQFLEVGKRENLGFSSVFPGIKNPISAALTFPATGLENAVQNPIFQIAPMQFLLKALKERAFVRTLAHPVVITRSGEKASFLAGGEVPIVSQSEQSNQKTHSSVTYKPFGILFHVLPRLQSDGSIWLKLNLEVSDVAEHLSFQNVPGFTSRKISTTIVLSDGNLAVLSGLVQSKKSKSVSKFPLLSSVPILGELFKSRKFLEEESELWVAVSAMSSQSDMIKKSSEKFEEFKIKEMKKDISPSLLD